MGRRRLRPDDVLVVDASRQFVDYVQSGFARRLVRGGFVSVLRRSPFTVILPPGQRVLPKIDWRAKKETKMQPQYRQPGTNSFNWLKFFEEEKDIWIQNISAMQWSFEIELGAGQDHPVLLPQMPDPYCLSDEVAFELLKKSTKLRKIVGKRKKGQPVLRLMDGEEAHAWFQNKARQRNMMDANGEPDVDAAMTHAQQRYVELTTQQTAGQQVGADGNFHFAPPKSAQELMASQQPQQPPMNARDLVAMNEARRGMGNNPVSALSAEEAQMMQRQAGGFANVGAEQITLDEAINPHVLHLCQQVSLQLKPNDRMPAADFFERIQTMGPSLTANDLQYVESHGTYKTVKRWAAMQLQERFGGGDEGIEDGLGDSLLQPASAPTNRQSAPRMTVDSGNAPSRAPVAPQYMEHLHQPPTGFANGPGVAAEPQGLVDARGNPAGGINQL